MPAISYQQAKDQLDAMLAANIKAAASQETTANGRSLQRAQLDQIQKSIEFWEKKVNTLEPDAKPGIKLVQIIPI